MGRTSCYDLFVTLFLLGCLLIVIGYMEDRFTEIPTIQIGELP